MFMNEHDIEEAVQRWSREEFPNLLLAAETLERFKDWVNSNSDGWPYWSPPLAASRQLQTKLTEAQRAWFTGTVEDLNPRVLAQATRPIKTFLTKRGADWRTILAAREPIVPIRYRSFKEDEMTLSECLLCGAVMGCPPDCDKNYIRVLQDRIRALAKEANR